MFSPILRSHLQRYPEMQIQDVYKLIHQAALGSEHAVSDPSAAGVWLEREFKEIGMGPDEPLLDSISPDEEIVRVHLRPYRAMKRDKEALLSAFIRTANEFPGDRITLETYWSSAIQAQHYPAPDMVEFIMKMKEKDYPAAHHSEEYKLLYRPSYRVIWRKYLPDLNLFSN